MAHTKSKGTSKLGRDSQSKRLGVKIFGGEKIKPGQIIVRQKGTKFFAGDNVKKGSDYTLYAAKAGVVKFIKIKRPTFTGRLKDRKFVSVVSTK